MSIQPGNDEQFIRQFAEKPSVHSDLEHLMLRKRMSEQPSVTHSDEKIRKVATFAKEKVKFEIEEESQHKPQISVHQQKKFKRTRVKSPKSPRKLQKQKSVSPVKMASPVRITSPIRRFEAPVIPEVSKKLLLLQKEERQLMKACRSSTIKPASQTDEVQAQLECLRKDMKIMSQVCERLVSGSE